MAGFKLIYPYVNFANYVSFQKNEEGGRKMSGVFGKIRFTAVKEAKLNNNSKMASDDPALPGSTV
jgi:hypothetical protein